LAPRKKAPAASDAGKRRRPGAEERGFKGELRLNSSPASKKTA
jgi:hypothetical protein